MPLRWIAVPFPVGQLVGKRRRKKRGLGQRDPVLHPGFANRPHKLGTRKAVLQDLQEPLSPIDGSVSLHPQQRQPSSYEPYGRAQGRVRSETPHKGAFDLPLPHRGLAQPHGHPVEVVHRGHLAPRRVSVLHRSGREGHRHGQCLWPFLVRCSCSRRHVGRPR